MSNMSTLLKSTLLRSVVKHKLNRVIDLIGNLDELAVLTFDLEAFVLPHFEHDFVSAGRGLGMLGIGVGAGRGRARDVAVPAVHPLRAAGAVVRDCSASYLAAFEAQVGFQGAFEYLVDGSGRHVEPCFERAWLIET